ncbi:hypothetical protein EDD15DRAFT_2194461 [Pisolithus albus]|nr:hypothetical protein EDD15DRAFT_2194461 [Pisolithus albus]
MTGRVNDAVVMLCTQQALRHALPVGDTRNGRTGTASSRWCRVACEYVWLIWMPSIVVKYKPIRVTLSPQLQGLGGGLGSKPPAVLCLPKIAMMQSLANSCALEPVDSVTLHASITPRLLRPVTCTYPANHNLHVHIRTRVCARRVTCACPCSSALLTPEFRFCLFFFLGTSWVWVLDSD